MNPIEKAIALVGASTLAAQIKAEPSQLSNWKKRGAPAAYCHAIEQACGGKVTRQQLRPKDWHLLWPDLARTKARRLTDKK